MLKRALPAFVLFALALGTLLHCGGAADPNDEIGGRATEAGATSCRSTGTCVSSGASGTSATSGGSDGSSGQGGTSSGSGNASSSGSPPPVPVRIATKVGLPTSSAGCGNAAPPARGEQHWNGGRYYIPFQPADYSSAGPGGGKGYPVLVALHGCYGSPDYFANNFGSFQDAVGSDGVIVYGAAQNAQSSCGWDVGGQSDMDYLDSLLADVASQYCIDQSRVFLLGFSWGGYMAQRYACNRPGTIKAMVGGASGWPDWQALGGMDTRECGQIPALIYGRTHDGDEQVSKSYHARDQRVSVNGCNAAGNDSYWPFDPNRDNPPAEFGLVARCVDYGGCVNNLRTTFCEDPKDLTDPDIGGQPDWNHTIWQPYHRPIWEWLRNLP